jgi:hypothetical protein
MLFSDRKLLNLVDMGWRIGIRFPEGTRLFVIVAPSRLAVTPPPPTSYPMGIGNFFPDGKATGA